MANPKLNFLLWDRVPIAHGHVALDDDGTTDCVHHTGELDQNAIPSGVKDPAAIGLTCGVNQFVAEGSKATHRTFLVRAG